MAHDTSADDRISPVPRPMRSGIAAIASQLGGLLAKELMRRKTRAALWALDDHLLKDIGVSRGGIERTARDAADTVKQRTFTAQPLTQPNPTQPKEKRHDIQDCFAPKT